MQPLLLLGDEAIAQGAIDAGISGVYAYPGTPSTEITEYIQKSEEAHNLGIRSKWSCNEKTAMEAALGMSYAGKRALVCMKHVGLNVASDAFINSAITGANGGLVVIAADDPSMHSSQNEQDSRFYADFAHIPFFEPSSQQEAYEIVAHAFDMSEQYGIPVLIRITTRLAHSRADVVRHSDMPKSQNAVKLPEDPRQFVLLPAIARRNYDQLIVKKEAFLKASDDSEYNDFRDADDRSIGIIASGIAANYVEEAFGGIGNCPYPFLKIVQYPAPLQLLNQCVKACEKVIVFEDGYPFIEQQLKGLIDDGINVSGRLDGTLPRTGELNPSIAAKALSMDLPPIADVPDVIAPRPPSLCKGCPHANVYDFMKTATESFPDVRVFSDIGCYTLGALPPYNAINSCVDMGASITMAKGAAEAGLHPSVAVIGDSTFTHSGITGLLDVVQDQTPVTIIISDNLTTGMTGGQDSSACGVLENIVLGVGVEREHMHVLEPLPKQHEHNTEILKKELAFQGPSVIIARRECIQIIGKK